MTKRGKIMGLLVMLIASTTMAQTVAQWPEVTREAKPGSRWWWMGSAVDGENLERNIKAYAQTGIGTLEITPIYGVTGNEGNELSYLSNGWMNALKICQEAGKTQGVDIDMNGGTGWPFGGPWVKIADAAGKLLTKTATHSLTESGQITMDVRAAETNATLNKVMAYQQDGDQQVADVTQYVEGTTLKWQAPKGEWLLVAIYNGHTGQQVKRAAPGGEGYVLDHYNAEAVKRYLQHFDERFEAVNAAWPHSFFNDSYEVYGADWTPNMFAEFEKYRGYKLEEKMDMLLGLGKRKDANNQVLADYRQTLSDMLLNNFTRQWADWAHGHGATVRNQGHGSPGNLIDFYAAVDIPEIEGFGITDFGIRGLRTDPGFTSKNLSDLATLKYASSAAHVTGKKMVSSETFTWLAEHFRVSLSQMKPELGFMFVAGVNHIFFHGTTYSPQEAAWPGWKFYASIDMSPTNSIWRDAPWLMEYATRCQSFLQMGSADNDVLVYAPFCDAMHQNTGANAARLQLFDINTLSQKIPSMVKTVKNLETVGMDCDFISDQLLTKTTFANGMLQTEAGMTYKAIVVPVSTNMPAETKAHLDALAQQGATIVYDNDATTLATLAKGEEMRTKLGLRLIRRKNATGHHYFVTNLSDKDIEGMVSLAVPFKGIALFNPMTGNIRKAYTEGDKVWISLKSGQSVILQTYDTDVAIAETDVPVTETEPVIIDTPWTLSFTDSTYAAQPLGTYQMSRPTTWERLDQATGTAMGTGIYETTFYVGKTLLDMANGGLRLNLGDVRESARVYINNVFVGCVWSAPFVIDITGKLKEGANTLRIEVTNLPANRIRQMDIDGTKWRIFKDVNMLSIVNGNTSQSNVTYEKWSLVPSGLNGNVTIIPLRCQKTELTARLLSFSQQGDDYYPSYKLTTPGGTPVKAVTITDESGTAFTDYELDAEQAILILKGDAGGYVKVMAEAEDGSQSETYLKAYGAHSLVRSIDFTQDVAPACGWQVLTNKTTVAGFSDKSDWRRAPGQNTTTLALLADGVTAKSEKGAYFFYYVGYGMSPTTDIFLNVEGKKDDVCLISYMQGSKAAQPYQAADSLVMITYGADSTIVFELPSRAEYYVYRTLQQYRPRNVSSAIVLPRRHTDDLAPYYTLQGMRTTTPKRGLYIRNGKKVILK